jgi:nucleoside-diphosphate-sugar epimerase
MSLFLTGATGFVGQSVVRAALSRGHAIRALVRHEAHDLPGNVTPIRGNIDDIDLMSNAMRGCDAVIHLVGIIRQWRNATFFDVHAQGTANVVIAAQSAGVRRFIHMSANGTRPNAISRYHQSKWLGETYLRQRSGLDWTIFRPSLIHGPGGEFTQMEAAWARGTKAPWLAMPYFGRGLLGMGGSSLVAPVYVEDVTRAFVEALTNEKAIGQTYALAGSEIMDWPRMHRLFASAIAGKPTRATLPIPAWYAAALARIVPAALLPFNLDQVQMSREDNIADPTHFARDFGWTPRGLTETLPLYATARSGSIRANATRSL